MRGQCITGLLWNHWSECSIAQKIKQTKKHIWNFENDMFVSDKLLYAIRFTAMYIHDNVHPLWLFVIQCLHSASLRPPIDVTEGMSQIHTPVAGCEALQNHWGKSVVGAGANNCMNVLLHWEWIPRLKRHCRGIKKCKQAMAIACLHFSIPLQWLSIWK